ncbi:MAG TPA: cytochrome c [Blastocatellia bacterium]|nr:cytochrome c [Blastocatellia bacterium]
MKKLASLSVISLLFGAALYLSPTLGVARASSGDAKAGLEVHKKNCLRCHGERGKGDGPAAKLLKTKPTDWSDKAKMSALSDQDLFKVITKGGEAAGKSKLMPAFGGKLSDQDVHNVIAFIRSLAK